ncbi:DNA polymerase III subunit delta' [Companilactobacillus sp.]|jgi:DNA polymerase-3 subunit delta'|uniref:DNA polymerase III subunit delta' n=1 Tax=Companilactobacillus sp. TaxID=2767905 RepID=UPI0025C5D216|nr:DNA polymerase III subunit delta' [Companilactobacillus sp.]MCH4010258.1 DNA polymerase III subunit delta' [Companilactobacillus sp.]MCH4052066.1 DNA polymerase III subunit delta' [Companilactobacillus sp.]MCH4078200.1 DNA polymerase III subunit delta' [Companilactobacillus sp.]MCH4126776.1 DNA polymerase III subunit delta' [Companilactobacillus sp.]MCH4132361.1 DNA polymerase III subunit delta' [Companilactobacillus sp.]
MEDITQEQPKVISEFQKIIQANMLSHAYLIDDASSQVRNQMAIWIAQTQFCEHLVDGLPDQTCQKCQNIALGDNPDVLQVTTDKQSIGVDDIKFFKKEANMTATQGNRRILIINEAEKMTSAASNNLLKTIEEPEGNLMIILLCNSAKQMLPTIQSRVQIFHLSNKSNSDEIADLQKVGYKEATAKLALTMSDVKYLLSMNGDNYQALHGAIITWLKRCNNRQPDSFIDVQTDIMPLIENKSHQQLFFDMMNQIFSDILSIRYNLDNTKLVNEDILSNRNIPTVVEFSEELFHAEEMWKSNVAFQAILEDLSLKYVN